MVERACDRVQECSLAAPEGRSPRTAAGAIFSVSGLSAARARARSGWRAPRPSSSTRKPALFDESGTASRGLESFVFPRGLECISSLERCQDSLPRMSMLRSSSAWVTRSRCAAGCRRGRPVVVEMGGVV